MLFFRADGNEKIGAGHIMRCLSIAEAAKEKRNDVYFYTAGNEFSKTILQRGIKNIVINSDFMNMESELVFLKKEIESNKPNYVFIDSYYVTEKYLNEIRNICHRYGGKLVYIDDVMAFAYPCDILINYNIFGTDMRKNYIDIYEKALSIIIPELLLGLPYVPLRKAFTNIPERKVNLKGRKILISTGGADTAHIGLEIAKILVSGAYKKDLRNEYHILIGAMNKDKEEIEMLIKGDNNVITHYNIEDMASLMLSCDIAVSAAGSTLYELCATQTPTITYVLADNQILGAEGFMKAGLMEFIGDSRIIGSKKLAEMLVYSAEELIGNYSLRKKFSTNMKKFDGNGVERILNKLK